MASTKSLSPLTPEQRRAAAGQFERANQVLAAGNRDYGIELLLNCCLLDPGSFVYRQALRNTVKAKHNNNRKGESLAFLKNMRAKLRLQAALKIGDYLKVLEQGEYILLRNPWEVSTHLAMATALEYLDLNDQALWMLDQARQQEPTNLKILRPLARVLEKRGNFTQAIPLWEIIRKADPRDLEAAHKAKDLAANATIAKGKYQEAVDGAGPTPLAALQAETAVADEAETPETTEQTPAFEEKISKEAAALSARIDANPTNANAYLHLAGYYRRNDQLEQAQAVLQRGLGPTGNHFELMMELMDLEIDVFRRDLAIAEEHLRTNPDDDPIQKIRADLIKEIANRELQYYRARLDRMPTDAASKFEMGVRLFRLGRIDEAIKELQGIRTDPRHHARALYYLGFCFKHRNNWRLAQRNFEESLQHLAANEEGLRKEVLYQLATGCAHAGDLARAVDLACELANLDFSYKDISALMDQWQSRTQKA